MLIVLAGLGAASWWALGRDAGARSHPNVLLVSIDSLRADRVGAYGNPADTTPALDALAREGALFRNAISSSSWTIPAHISLFTALQHREHRVASAGRRLRPEATTLTEVLHDAGYATAGFVSGPTVRGVYGLAQGFELYDDESAVQPNRRLSQKGVTAPKVTELALAWLERWTREDRGRPFFLFLHYWDVHYDYEPPPPYDGMFDPHYRGDLTSHELETSARIHAGMPPRDLEHLLALYDGEVRFTDDHLARVLAWLDSAGLAADTVVVVTADHGDEFFEHGRKGHGFALYDETIRVPLVMRFPGRIPEGLLVERQVRATDVAPTILGLAGIPAPGGFGGRSSEERFWPRDLSRWLTGASPPEALPDLVAVSELRRDHGAIRTNRHKLIVVPREETVELYDLVADPGEQNDLLASGEHPAAAELGALFDRWKASVAERRMVSERWEPDRDLLERLQALGYVKDDAAKREKRNRKRKRRQRRAAP